MTSMVSAVRSRAVGLVARRFSLSMLPDTLLWPLLREGLDPVPRMAELREEPPVSRLPLPLGIRAWLVTGYEPVRAVLGSADGFSNDFGQFAGAGRPDGGAGARAVSAWPTRRCTPGCARLLTPEFTMRRLARLQPRIDAIVTDRLDAMAAHRRPGRPVAGVRAAGARR